MMVIVYAHGWPQTILCGQRRGPGRTLGDPPRVDEAIERAYCGSLLAAPIGRGA